MCRLGLSAVAVLLLAATAPANPLEYIPDSVQIVVKAPAPRQLAEAFTRLDAAKKARQLAQIKSALDSAFARRVFQMLGHVERELGAPWPKLLDRIAGGGIAVGAHYDKPAILVLDGTDEKLSEKAFDLFVEIVGDELQRQGAPAGRANRGTGPSLSCSATVSRPHVKD
jgi:hypothetical protein